jgi:hypothetical protein
VPVRGFRALTAKRLSIWPQDATEAIFQPGGRRFGRSSPALPSPSFARWSRKLDEVRICAQCGREIIARRRNVRGEVVKELVSAENTCWNCARPACR